MSRIYYSSSVIWISKTKLTCPSGKLRTEFTCSKAKSTSLGLSDTTILARWFAWIFGPKQCPECKNSTFRFLAPIGALPNASPRIAYTSSETQGQSVGLENRRDESFQSWAEEPLGTPWGCFSPIGHNNTKHFFVPNQEPAFAWPFGNDPVRVGTQGVFRLCLKTFVEPFLPAPLTAPGSPRMQVTQLGEKSLTGAEFPV